MTLYQGSEIEVVLQTNIILTDATVSILAKKPGGDTVTLTGEVTDLTSITATLSTSDNNEAGQWLLQAKAEFDEGDPVFGETEKMFIQIPFAETPEP